MSTTETATGNGPQYLKIYNYLFEKISSGVYKNGDMLPTEKQLCEQFAVSRITSKKALDMLAEKNLVSRIPGSGSFISIDEKPSQSDKGSIALIISDFSDAFGTRLIYGIEESCAKAGYNLIVRRTHDDVKIEQEALHTLAQTAKGILIVPVHGEYYSPEILKQVLAKLPLVFVDRKMRGLPIPSVSSNNFEAAENAVKHLLEKGHRHIAFFSGTVEYTSTVEERIHGFTGAFASYGVKIDPALLCTKLSSSTSYPFYTDDSIAADIERIKNILTLRPMVTAALVTEYAMSLIVQKAAELLGKKIPQDFSIVGFDSPATIVGKPYFTHLKQDEEQIGKKAVDSLLAIINGAEPSSIGDIQIHVQLIEGSTVAVLHNQP